MVLECFRLLALSRLLCASMRLGSQDPLSELVVLDGCQPQDGPSGTVEISSQGIEEF